MFWDERKDLWSDPKNDETSDCGTPSPGPAPELGKGAAR